MRARLLVSVLLATACQGTGTGATDDALVVTLQGGTAQSSLAGSAVAVPPAVLVTRRGAAVSGVRVEFRVTGGGGSLEGAVTTTGIDGIARAGRWVLGSAGPQAVEAIIADALGSPIRFSAQATTADPVAVSAIEGAQITSTVALPVSIRPVLRVTDGAGRPIPGVAVDWQIGSGGGGLRYGDPVTGSDGTARVIKWVLGTMAGENTLVATVDCPAACRPVVFRATGVAGPVTAITVVTGDRQQAPAGSTLPVAPSVRLYDGYGNPAGGRTVQFEVAAGGGGVASAIATSNDNGVASPGSWQLGSSPGENRLRVTVEGVTVVLSATGT